MTPNTRAELQNKASIISWVLSKHKPLTANSISSNPTTSMPTLQCDSVQATLGDVKRIIIKVIIKCAIVMPSLKQATNTRAERQ